MNSTLKINPIYRYQFIGEIAFFLSFILVAALLWNYLWIFIFSFPLVLTSAHFHMRIFLNKEEESEIYTFEKISLLLLLLFGFSEKLWFLSRLAYGVIFLILRKIFLFEKEMWQNEQHTVNKLKQIQNRDLVKDWLISHFYSLYNMAYIFAAGTYIISVFFISARYLTPENLLTNEGILFSLISIGFFLISYIGRLWKFEFLLVSLLAQIILAVFISSWMAIVVPIFILLNVLRILIYQGLSNDKVTEQNRIQQNSIQQF